MPRRASQRFSLTSFSTWPDGAPFDLRAFHDSLWLNGNVPIELQAYETLGGPPPPAIRRLFGEAAKL